MSTVAMLRQFRIGGFSVFDFATTLLGTWLLSPLLSAGFRELGIEIPRTNWLWLAIPIGELVHLVLGLKTPLYQDVVDPSGHYLWKLAFIIMIVMGLRGIHLVRQ